MIGQDYYTWGSKRHILCRFGDNHGHPYPGPIFLHFLDDSLQSQGTAKGRGRGGGKLLLWNRLGSLYIQSLAGTVETFIHPLSQRVVVQKKIEALVEAEYFEGDDWPSRFLQDSQLVSSPSAARHVYADFLPLAVCLLPQSSLLAVADVSFKIKLFDLTAQAVQSSFGSAGLDVGSFSQPTALESVSLGGQQTVLLVGDSGANQRLYCFTLTGKLIAWMGEKGPMPGQFRDIASLSACIDYARNSPHRHGTEGEVDLMHYDYLPRWYRGHMAMEDLEEGLFDASLESNFVLGQRLHEAKTYDLLQITSSKRIQRLLIREEVDEIEGSSKGFYIANRTGDKVNYPSLFDLIRSQKDLHFGEECRDSLLIAAVDRKNFRVQIIRFFWTESFLFAPKMEVVVVLGGIKNRQCVLRDPVCAKYGNNRELCICDNGANAVLILSSNYEVVKTISLSYLSAKEALFIGKKTDNGKFALTKMEMENARKPCWISISSVGQLAISYKSGGDRASSLWSGRS